MELLETTLRTDPKYHGIVVDVRVDTVRLPNGKESRREVVSHPGGVAVLPITEEGDTILVRQYRYAMGRELLEAPAGKLEPGEDPRLAALRELEEEVGVIPGNLEYLGGLYVSPGISTETIHLYLATDLKQGVRHPDEDEFLNMETLPFAALLEQVLAGQIPDAKTAALVMRAALQKERQTHE